MNDPKSGLSPKWFFQLVDALCLLAAFAIAYFSLPTFGPWLNPGFAQLYETSSAFLLILALPLLVFSFASTALVLLTTARLLERQYYRMRRRAGYYARNILVIGTPEHIESIEHAIKASSLAGDYQVIPWTKERVSEGDEPPIVGTRWEADLRGVLLRQATDEVLLVVSSATESNLDRVAAICGELAKPLRFVPEFSLRHLPVCDSSAQAHPDVFAGLPSLLLRWAEPAASYQFVKRLIDILISAVLLVLFSPLFVVIGLAVRLTSPGPILYRWHVMGRNNKEFVGYKFRSMVANADQLKAELLAQNEMSGPVFKIKNDPRVTPVGRFLRKYSLDELPQLWNVLKGDMSLVGPRPPLKNEFERFQFWQARKLSVRPGITCLWQVNGRNEIKDFDEWARLDLEYIDKRSLGLDLRILARTAIAVLSGTGR